VIFSFHFFAILKVFLNFANEKRKESSMARPIKETPILYGEEAHKFEMRMQSPELVSQERQERIVQDYEFMRSRCVNCSF
jgi:hypothetical protein